MSSWTIWAKGALPVSTSSRPSSVANEETLAKDGQNPTPSVISTNPPMWSTGWKVDVDNSPFHRRSATARTSDGMDPHQALQAPGVFSSAEGVTVSTAAAAPAAAPADA